MTTGYNLDECRHCKRMRLLDRGGLCLDCGEPPPPPIVKYEKLDNPVAVAAVVTEDDKKWLLTQGKTYSAVIRNLIANARGNDIGGLKAKID